MIVRVLGDGQYELSDEAAQSLDPLDAALNAAIESGDEGAFDAAFANLLDAVRTRGRLLDTATIVPSDLTVPHEGATLAEIQALLASEPDLETEGAGRAEEA